MIERELKGAGSAEEALLAGVGMAVFDDGDGSAARARHSVHASLNTRHALKATTAPRIPLTHGA